MKDKIAGLFPKDTGEGADADAASTTGAEETTTRIVYHGHLSESGSSTTATTEPKQSLELSRCFAQHRDDDKDTCHRNGTHDDDSKDPLLLLLSGRIGHWHCTRLPWRFGVVWAFLLTSCCTKKKNKNKATMTI